MLQESAPGEFQQAAFDEHRSLAFCAGSLVLCVKQEKKMLKKKRKKEKPVRLALC